MVLTGFNPLTTGLWISHYDPLRLSGNNMTRLFGTDGIRGVANRFPITCEMALKTGRAVGEWVKTSGHDRVIIGKDTRISGDMLEAAIAAGIASTGINAYMAGVVPTPGVAFLTGRVLQAGAGIMISASHNPFEDNGIKLFDAKGMKLTDEQEQLIEQMIMSDQGDEDGPVGRIRDGSGQTRDYIDFLIKMFPKRKHLDPVRIVIDCSNGAASGIAWQVFNQPCIEPVFLYDAPDGKNINQGCGSQHLDKLIQTVLSTCAAAGFAFDGDADRMIAVDETGWPVTGDGILAICANHAIKAGELNPAIVVSTIMSNIGLSNTLKSLSVQHEITDVGDRKVFERMQQCGALMGGEDSGHLIFQAHHTTGDGMLSAIKLLNVMLETGQPLSRLAEIITVHPQVLINMEMDSSRPDIMSDPIIADEILAVEKKLGDSGRVLIRYSGTQPLLRVMVEGPDQDTTRRCALHLCDVIEKNIKK